MKKFKDSKGREYKAIKHAYGIAIYSKQKNGRYKQLDATKGKGQRLLHKYVFNKGSI